MKHWKFCYLALILLIISYNVYCQRFGQKNLPPNLTTYDDAPYHFGFTLSVSDWGFVMQPIDKYYEATYGYDQVQKVDYFNGSEYADKEFKILNIHTNYFSPGFAVGIVGDLRLGTYFDFRIVPGLSFTQQTVNYTLQEQNVTSKEINLRDESDKIECVYFDLPILLKYKGKRIHNVRPYIIGGVEGKVNFLSGVGYASHTDDRLSSLKLLPADLYYTMGGGMDFYMFWFKLGVELRMGYSMFDRRDKLGGNHFCTNSIESLKSKEFQVIFTFE